jgi:hypothetical protein
MSVVSSLDSVLTFLEYFDTDEIFANGQPHQPENKYKIWGVH